MRAAPVSEERVDENEALELPPRDDGVHEQVLNRAAPCLGTNTLSQGCGTSQRPRLLRLSSSILTLLRKSK